VTPTFLAAPPPRGKALSRGPLLPRTRGKETPELRHRVRGPKTPCIGRRSFRSV